MPIQYKPRPDAFYASGEEITEQEHKDSCDINKMIKAQLRGQQIRGGAPIRYGYDDTTMDGVSFRIQKQKLEEELKSSAKTELSEEAARLIPDPIKKQFGFKVKKAATKNDDQTTKQPAAKNQPAPTPEPKNTPPDDSLT